MRSRRKNNLLAFIVFLSSTAIIALSFFAFSAFFSSEDGILKKAYLENKNEARAEVRLSGEEQWNEVMNVYLHEGDTIHAKTKAGVEINFFENSSLLLDKDTIVYLSKIRQMNDESTLIEVIVEKGRLWTTVPRKLNPRSKFILKSANNNLVVETSNASFSFADNEIAVIQGEKILAYAEKSAQEDLFSSIISVGQMLKINTLNFSGGTPVMISDEFRNSEWYKFYCQKDEQIIIAEEDEPEEGDKVVFEITEPSKNEEFNSNQDTLFIKGIADETIAKIKVNNWELSKYSSGQEWSYKISPDFQNSGVNNETKTYTAEAYNKNEELIASDKIKISFKLSTENITEETPVDTEEDETEVSGELKITTPENNTESDAEEIIITGTAPSNAYKIVVHNYTLSAFQKGDTEWSYKIREDFGNMGEVGESITYKVQAYDKSDKLVGFDEITIKFLEKENQATQSTTNSISSEISR